MEYDSDNDEEKVLHFNQTPRIMTWCILLYILYCVSGPFAHMIYIVYGLMYNNMIGTFFGLIAFYIVLNESYRYGDRNPMDDLMMIIFVPLEFIGRIIYRIVDPIFSFIGFN
jgi:hypothetical protein